MQRLFNKSVNKGNKGVELRETDGFVPVNKADAIHAKRKFDKDRAKLNKAFGKWKKIPLENKVAQNIKSDWNSISAEKDFDQDDFVIVESQAQAPVSPAKKR